MRTMIKCIIILEIYKNVMDKQKLDKTWMNQMIF